MHNSFEFATKRRKESALHNLGNGKFEDVTDKMGVGIPMDLAAASADFNELMAGQTSISPMTTVRKSFISTITDVDSFSALPVWRANQRAVWRWPRRCIQSGSPRCIRNQHSERGYLFQNNNLRLNEMPESAVPQRRRRRDCRRGWPGGASR